LKRYKITYDRTAVFDMAELHGWISREASQRIASSYLNRIRLFCRQLRQFPNRGILREDIRPGTRIITFEGRVDIAFEVQADRVVIIRILYAGRQFDSR
jgi:toxin ParE1/3/4